MVTAASERLKIDPSDFRFFRRELREHTGWGDTQLRAHLQRLVEMEYLLVHQGRRGRSYVYELLYDGNGLDGGLFLPGLIDIEILGYDAKNAGLADKNAGLAEKNAGPKEKNAGPTRAHRGGFAGGLPEEVSPVESEACGENRPNAPESTTRGSKKRGTSQRSRSRRTRTSKASSETSPAEKASAPEEASAGAPSKPNEDAD